MNATAVSTAVARAGDAPGAKAFVWHIKVPAGSRHWMVATCGLRAQLHRLVTS
jgi:hypothetical protein